MPRTKARGKRKGERCCACYLRCQERDRCRCHEEFVHGGRCYCGQKLEASSGIVNDEQRVIALSHADVHLFEGAGAVPCGKLMRGHHGSLTACKKPKGHSGKHHLYDPRDWAKRA